jgi:peptidoglycan LD-endopeptidase LytH
VISFKTPAFRRLVAFLATGLFLFGLTSHSATADTQQQLDEARAKLKAIEKRLIAGQSQLAALRARVDVIIARINDVESVIAVIQSELNTVEQEIAVARKRLLATQAQLDQRARVTYQSGGGLMLEFVLGSTSLADLGSRLEIVDRATASDRALIVRIQSLEARLKHRQTKLGHLQDRRLEERNSLTAQNAALQEQLAAENGIVAQINRDRQEAHSIVSHLQKKRQREIRAARRALRLAMQSQFGAPPGPAIGGVLQVCPVDQPRHYIDDFGFPRFSGGFHRHQGNDIFAPYGTPIRAPFAGTASGASNGLGGLAVKVYGPQGYAYNAHLSRLGALGSVSAGTIIGYVGNSGDARGTSPHDHFEWHPGNGGAISPFAYLNAVC